jgi:hypothetical protein
VPVIGYYRAKALEVLSAAGIEIVLGSEGETSYSAFKKHESVQLKE